MEPGQKTAYISDIGSYQMKPVFVFGTVIAIGTFQVTYSILIDWMLYFTPRKGHRNTADAELALIIAIAVLSTLALIGGVNLALWDKAKFQRAHQVFLAMFL